MCLTCRAQILLESTASRKKVWESKFSYLKICLDSGSEFFKNKTYPRIIEGYERFHPDFGVIRLGPCTPNKHDC